MTGNINEFRGSGFDAAGAGKSAIGESRSENELILKANTKYLIKATSRAVGTYITAHMNGYICGIGE